MEITGEVLQKIEDKLWKNLEELNKDEKNLIKQENSSLYVRCHFSDSYKYSIYIYILHGLKKIVDHDESYIRYYGLEEFETEEDKSFPLIVDYKINDCAEIVVNTTLGTFHIPPHLFNKMIDESIKEGYLSYSINLHRFNSGGYDESLEFKIKPKTEEED